MPYEIETIAEILKDARAAKGLSQRDLAEITGMPQSQISKIESGAVDLRTSSLIEMARALDLELALVPRRAVPAVQSIMRHSALQSGENNKILAATLKSIDRVRQSIALAEQANPALRELVQMQNRMHEIRRLIAAIPDSGAIAAANKTIKAIKPDTKNIAALRKSLSRITALRNALLNAAADRPAIETSRPAYSLEGEDNG